MSLRVGVKTSVSGTLFLAVVLSGLCSAQSVSLNLSSGLGIPGALVTLSLSVTSTGNAPAAVEWTANYATADILSVVVTPGLAATLAGKTVSCKTGSGTVTCVIWGVNANTIANGVVANLAFLLSPLSLHPSTVISLLGGVSDSLLGSTIATTTSGATVTIGSGQTVPVTVTSSPSGRSLAVDSAACTAPCQFQWTPGSNHTVAVTSSPQAGAAGTQYVFSNWSDNGAQSHSITAPSSATTYTANFATQYYLTTNATTGGSIAPPSEWVNSGTSVMVTATPQNGYQFTGFSGGTLSGNTNPASFAMAAPATVTANFAPVTGSGWYNPAWDSREPITVNNGQVNGTLTNFPMLYSVTDASLVGNTQASGNDILFTASDGVTKLNHEIESYNASTGQLVAWVKVPSLASGTGLYIYFGNPSASNQQNAAGVWDGNFEMVQHFPNGSALSANDSTANHCNASTLNATSPGTGQIGGAARFNGTSNSIDFAPCGALNNWTAQTVSLWIKAQPGMAQYARMIEKGSNDEWSVVWNYDAGSNQLTMQQLGSSANLVAPANPLADNAWHKLDLTVDSSENVSLYVDGALNAQGQSPSGPQGTTGNIRLGQFGGGGFYYAGMADELRISRSVRTAAWLQAEYHNEKSPGAFSSAGPVQSNGAATTTVTSSPAGLSLTVDSAACTAPCRFQWTPGSSHRIAVTINPQAGGSGTQYLYSNWSDSGAQSHLITAPSGSTTFTANFTTQYYLTTNATTGGAISPSSEWVNAGATVTLMATPANGYQFSGFTGAVTSLFNPVNLVVGGPSSVTANFTKGGPPWYNTGWRNRKTITVNAGQVSGTLTNFPMLYSVTDGNLVGNTQASGNDILFTASDGVTKLNHEIESYNAATGQLVAWVNVPSLASGTVIYIYFGNPAAANQQSPAAVWDSNFEMVQHYPGGSPLNASDSTGKGNNGSVTAASATTGEVGGAASMNGFNSQIRMGSTSGLGISGPLTISAWVNVSQWPAINTIGTILEKAFDGATEQYYLRVINNNGILQLNAGTYYGSGVDHSVFWNIAGWNTGEWHLATGTFDGANWNLYVDGTMVATRADTHGPYANSGGVYIGASNLAGLVTRYFNGVIDETRVSRSARPLAWLQAEHKSERYPGTFVALGVMNAATVSGNAGDSAPITESFRNGTAPAGSRTVEAATEVKDRGRAGGAPAVAGISCTPATLIPPAASTCMVTIAPAAPTAGTTVSLYADSSNAALPASLTIPAGATSASFPVRTVPVGIGATVQITAAAGPASASFPLSLGAVAAGGVGADATVSANSDSGAASIVSPPLSTKYGGELLLAFISTGAAASPAGVTSVSGAGLDWVRVKRAGEQPGATEIWRAFAPAALQDASITATLSASVESSLTIMSFSGVDPSGPDGAGAIGAIASAGAAGAASVSLTVTRSGSLVVGAGNATNGAMARSPGRLQNLVSEHTSPSGSTYWVQTRVDRTPVAGAAVSVDDISPDSGAYNLAAVEVRGPEACHGALLAETRRFSSGGGTGRSVVAAGPGCAWTAATDSPDWVSFNGGAGTGGGSFTLTVAPNATGHARMATVGAGGESFKILQSGSAQRFTDVSPGEPNFDYISLLYSMGIDAGCEMSPLRYCPSAPLTRGQLARWIAAALDRAAGAAPANAAAPYFRDVPEDSPYYSAVQRMREWGISAGCSADRFCPDQPVTRVELAASLIAAWMQAQGISRFTYTGTPYFADVPPGHPFFSFVQKAMDLEFGSGCSATEYCPSATVTRAEAAAMLLRSVLGAPGAQ